MSEFSEFCRILQEKSGMTIYQMAKVSGMERTALNRMVIGKRIPKQEDVDAFCKVVRANEKEKAWLRELYIMEKMGKKCYDNAQFIEKLLQELRQMKESEKPVFPPPIPNIGAEYEPMKPFIEGKEELERLICQLLEKEYRRKRKTELYSNFPAKGNMLFMAMSHFEQKYGKGIPLYHFFNLNVNPEKYYDADCNLKVMYYTLMWVLQKGADYIPYYTYSQLMLNDMELQMMPYYLVTAGGVLLISDDFQQGIFLDNPDTIHFYQEKMQGIRTQMKPLYQIVTVQRRDAARKEIDIKFTEEKVRITKQKEKGRCVAVVITESSLCEAFSDYFSFLEEKKWSAHGGAHIEPTESSGYTTEEREQF